MTAQRNVSPFPTVAKRKSVDHIDVSMLRVEHNTPLPKAARSPVRSKYEDLFSRMKVGSCIVCEPHEFNVVSAALRKHIQRTGMSCKVRGVARDDDGHSRIWLIAK